MLKLSIYLLQANQANASLPFNFQVICDRLTSEVLTTLMLELQVNYSNLKYD